MVKKRNYYIFNAGRLKRKDNSIEFILSDGMKKSIPINDIDSIYAFGELDFNKQAVNFLAQNGVTIHFFNYYGYYTGSFYPKETLVSGMLLVRQVGSYTDIEKRLFLAKKFLIAGTKNILHNLKYYNNKNDDLSKEIDDINDLLKKLETQENIPTLMAIEGNIRNIYYRSFNKIIKQDIKFEKRVRNPPDNMINTLISFCNTLLYTTILSEIYKTQLNPLISFLHEPGDRRFSLNLDVSEIFKPIICDRLIFRMLNRREITENDFQKELNGLYLKDSARKKILEKYDETLKQTVRHKGLKRNVSYRKLLRLELYKIIKHLLDEKEYKGFVIWW